MKQLKILRDVTDVPTWAIPFSDGNYNARITGGAESTVAVPTGARYALISGSDWYFVGRETVALPSSATFTLAAGHLGKEIADLETDTGDPVTTIYIIARADTDVSITFYG